MPIAAQFVSMASMGAILAWHRRRFRRQWKGRSRKGRPFAYLALRIAHTTSPASSGSKQISKFQIRLPLVNHSLSGFNASIVIFCTIRKNIGAAGVNSLFAW